MRACFEPKDACPSPTMSNGEGPTPPGGFSRRPSCDAGELSVATKFEGRRIKKTEGRAAQKSPVLAPLLVRGSHAAVR